MLNTSQAVLKCYLFYIFQQFHFLFAVRVHFFFFFCNLVSMKWTNHAIEGIQGYDVRVHSFLDQLTRLQGNVLFSHILTTH